jgi:hypothetical protein
MLSGRGIATSVDWRQAGQSAAFAVAWAISLVLPAVRFDNGQVLSGAAVLEQGWQAVRIGVVAWYANPLFLLSLVIGCSQWLRTAAVASGAALLLGLSSLAAPLMAGLVGTRLPSLSFELGFYLWLGVIALYFAARMARVCPLRRAQNCE